MARISKVKLAERREAEWELYVNGWTMPKIAKHYGLDVSTISDDLRTYRDAMPSATREQMIERHHAKLADIAERLEAIAAKPAPPVTAGKDGDIVRDPTDIDPLTGKGRIVRDYGAQAAALREIRATLAQEAKLAGLNAADKVEVSGNVTVDGPVDQELAALAAQLGMTTPVDPSRYAAGELSQGG